LQLLVLFVNNLQVI